MRHKITIAPTALRQLKEVTDRRVREKIIETIKRLADEPEKQGKPLVGDLAGFRSIRAVGQRYRVIYSVNRNEVTVIVVAVGLRKAGAPSDIYELARKLIGVALKGAATAQEAKGEAPRVEQAKKPRKRKPKKQK